MSEDVMSVSHRVKDSGAVHLELDHLIGSEDIVISTENARNLVKELEEVLPPRVD